MMTLQFLAGLCVGYGLGYMVEKIRYFRYEAGRSRRPMKVLTQDTPIDELRKSKDFRKKARNWTWVMVMILLILIWLAVNGI